MSLALFTFLPSSLPHSGHQRSPNDPMSARAGSFPPWSPAMSRAPRIDTTFRNRERELPRDPSAWVDKDLLHHVRIHYDASDAKPLSALITEHRLTPRALWYLQTDHDALVALAHEVSLQDAVLLLAQSVKPAVTPTTPRVRRAQDLSEELANPPPSPPPPPPTPPPEEEPLPEEDDDAAESIVSDWALDDQDELIEEETRANAPAAEEAERGPEPETRASEDSAAAHDSATDNTLGLHIDHEDDNRPSDETVPESTSQPAAEPETEDLIDLEDGPGETAPEETPEVAAQPSGENAAGDRHAEEHEEDVTSSNADDNTSPPHVPTATENNPPDAAPPSDNHADPSTSSTLADEHSSPAPVQDTGDADASGNPSSSDMPGAFEDAFENPWGTTASESGYGTAETAADETAPVSQQQDESHEAAEAEHTGMQHASVHQEPSLVPSNTAGGASDAPDHAHTSGDHVDETAPAAGASGEPDSHDDKHEPEAAVKDSGFEASNGQTEGEGSVEEPKPLPSVPEETTAEDVPGASEVETKPDERSPVAGLDERQSSGEEPAPAQPSADNQTSSVTLPSGDSLDTPDETTTEPAPSTTDTSVPVPPVATAIPDASASLDTPETPVELPAPSADALQNSETVTPTHHEHEHDESTPQAAQRPAELPDSSESLVKEEVQNIQGTTETQTEPEPRSLEVSGPAETSAERPLAHRASGESTTPDPPTASQTMPQPDPIPPTPTVETPLGESQADADGAPLDKEARKAQKKARLAEKKLKAEQDAKKKAEEEAQKEKEAEERRLQEAAKRADQQKGGSKQQPGRKGKGNTRRRTKTAEQTTQEEQEQEQRRPEQEETVQGGETLTAEEPKKPEADATKPEGNTAKLNDEETKPEQEEMKQEQEQTNSGEDGGVEPLFVAETEGRAEGADEQTQPNGEDVTKADATDAMQSGDASASEPVDSNVTPPDPSNEPVEGTGTDEPSLQHSAEPLSSPTHATTAPPNSSADTVDHSPATEHSTQPKPSSQPDAPSPTSPSSLQDTSADPPQPEHSISRSRSPTAQQSNSPSPPELHVSTHTAAPSHRDLMSRDVYSAHVEPQRADSSAAPLFDFQRKSVSQASSPATSRSPAWGASSSTARSPAWGASSSTSRGPAWGSSSPATTRGPAWGAATQAKNLFSSFTSFASTLIPNSPPRPSHHKLWDEQESSASHAPESHMREPRSQAVFSSRRSFANGISETLSADHSRPRSAAPSSVDLRATEPSTLDSPVGREPRALSAPPASSEPLPAAENNMAQARVGAAEGTNGVASTGDAPSDHAPPENEVLEVDGFAVVNADTPTLVSPAGSEDTENINDGSDQHMPPPCDADGDGGEQGKERDADMVEITTDGIGANEADNAPKEIETKDNNEDDDENVPLSDWVNVSKARQAAIASRSDNGDSDADDSAIEGEGSLARNKGRRPLRVQTLIAQGEREGEDSSPSSAHSTDAIGNNATETDSPGASPGGSSKNKRNKNRNKNKNKNKKNS